ncbi:MAG: DsbA family protein [Janthinobacterium lividum]
MSKLTKPVSAQDHVQGSADAACTLLEYGDFQCPSCGQAYEIVKSVQKHFGDKLRFVFREFPLEMHEFAEPAAETAEFAAKHDKFWPMHDQLFENQDQFSEELFTELAEGLKLDPKALAKSLEECEFEERVEQDVESGDASGVHGTPTFFINGKQLEGSYDEQSLIQAIDAAMRG